jgi:hypothetical protein
VNLVVNFGRLGKLLGRLFNRSVSQFFW